MIVVGLLGFIGVVVCIVMLLISLIKKKPKKKILISMLICVVMFSSAVTASSKDDSDKANNKEPSASSSEDHGDDSEQKTTDVSDSNAVAQVLDTTGYLKIDADVLFEYGNYMSGEKVVTVITVYQDGSDIKAKTSNNTGYFHSIICEFDDKDAAKQVHKGDIVTVAGTIKENDNIFDMPTVTLLNCSIIGAGEISQELKDNADEQRRQGEALKQAHEVQIATDLAAERDDYIAQCETVDYNDVERNPDNYDGRKILISGEVIQVSEGWFDSVAMRIDCNGDTWYVTYTHAEGESRILEGDQIVGYGECTGVTSYTSVLGSQVTIPSMQMKYFD